jgi:hypothetical protein
MKKLLAITIIFLLTTSFTSDYKEYVPVFMKRADLEQSVKYVSESRPLNNPGKIYTKGDYLYINEMYKGIHIINNANPAAPVQEGFIIIPGCIDMAVKGNILYADNAVDLVAFDLDSHTVTQRINNVLPEPKAPANAYYYGHNRGNDMILVGWQVK